MINHRWSSYPYSSNDSKLEIQRQAANKQRPQAESQRNLVAQQHLELLVNWAAVEEQRLINEELRVSGEAERKELEEQRCVSEHSRISAEKSRQAAEEVRQATEQARQVAEQLRQATEEARVVAEMLRQAAEEARQSTYEQQLVLNEMRHAVQEFDRINLELRPSTR